jgi:phosphoribosyl 1,2-cyclic phosphate phosphodiesterase
MKITILGCGSSSGVPVVGGGWGDCDPAEPRNRRRRASILVEHEETTLLVDASPDCRAQLLDAGVSRLDAVLFTHGHADHCHGIDDLRWINVAMHADLLIYANRDTLDLIDERFPYTTSPLKMLSVGKRYYKPVLIPNEITGPFRIGAIDIRPFVQDHGFSTTYGFRFGDMAYSTDLVALDDNAFDVLDGVRVWIVDAFCRKPHATHSHVERSLEWIARVKPERAVLTHMSPSLDYATLNAETPDNVEPAYDGMVLEI